MNKQDFILQLSKLRTNAMFLTIMGYRNEFSEVSNFNIVFHMNYENALRKSVLFLEQYVPVDDLQAQAKNELLNSLQSSLEKISSTAIEDIEDGYTRFYDGDKHIKGIKMHIATETLHLYGLVSQKKVLIPGVYPKKNKRPLTIAKDKLRYMCPVGKFRQFKILPQNVDAIKVENISLLPPSEK